jgi:glycosyltransferase involved in cell wall biosynthesis
MRILVFCSVYLPANRGGTLQTLAAVVDQLGGEHDFHIFTRDCDDGAMEPLAGIEPGRWQRVGKASVFYAPPSELSPSRMAKVVSSVLPDAYYVNSFFSPKFGATPVLLRWLRRVPLRPMVLAPRGEFHPAALRLKSFKKRPFIELARRIPAYADLLWQAGSDAEAAQIRTVFPRAQIVVARDLAAFDEPPPAHRRTKRAGELRVASLSRITPLKNIAWALRMLGRVTGDVTYSVYGPADDPAYMRKCTDLARTLPPNVHVRFEGELPHAQVLATLASHHVFLLPSLGESFGHAILEALMAGCVLVTSDQTPWRHLAHAGVGWDLPLDDELGAVSALQACVDMGDERFQAASNAACELGMSAASSQAAIEANRALLARLQVM